MIMCLARELYGLFGRLVRELFRRVCIEPLTRGFGRLYRCSTDRLPDTLFFVEEPAQ